MRRSRIGLSKSQNRPKIDLEVILIEKILIEYVRSEEEPGEGGYVRLEIEVENESELEGLKKMARKWGSLEGWLLTVYDDDDSMKNQNKQRLEILFNPSKYLLYLSDCDRNKVEVTYRQEIVKLNEGISNLKDHLSIYEDIIIEKEYKEHINRLHRYNEIKDLGQALLGRLATIRGTTTRKLYEEFDLHLDD